MEEGHWSDETKIKLFGHQRKSGANPTPLITRRTPDFLFSRNWEPSEGMMDGANYKEILKESLF